MDSFRTEIPLIPCPGLYVFLDDEGAPIYVGQSRDIKDRVGQHRRSRKRRWAKHAEARYRPLPGGEDARLVAETLMILRHRPKHNKSIKLGLTNDGRFYETQFIRR